MTDPTFVSNRVAELPVCFRDDQGVAWASGMGSGQDSEVTLLRTAALSRLPQYCPDDALDLCGTWFAIPRLPGEPDGTTTTGYRGRLCAAWPTWIAAGSKQGIIASLEAAGFANVQVFNKHEYDPGAEWWSAFKVTFDGSHSVPPIDPTIWGTFTWGDPWGADITAQQLLQIIGQILRWKWSYSIPDWLTVDFSDGSTITLPLTWHWGDDAFGMVWGDFDWGNAPLSP